MCFLQFYEETLKIHSKLTPKMRVICDLNLQLMKNFVGLRLWKGLDSRQSVILDGINVNSIFCDADSSV